MAVHGEKRMPHRVDTLMDPMHPPGRDTLVDDFGAQTKVRQLPQSNHPMLPRGKPSEGPVNRAALSLTGRFSSI